MMPAVGKSGAGMISISSSMRGLGMAQQVQAGVDHFVEVVRRNVGRHAHRDAAGAVDQQIRQFARQYQRFFFAAVVIGAEIDRFLVDIGQHFVRNLGQPNFGVAHGGRVVAVDRTEIALAVDQHVAHREVLRQPHDGVVDRLVAVRVVLADHVAHDTGRLLVGPVPVVVELVHRIQHAPMHRLEAVPSVGQGASHDHAHGVVEVAAPHFLFEADGQSFFGERGHEAARRRRRRPKFYAAEGVAPPQHKAGIPPLSYASGAVARASLPKTRWHNRLNVLGGGHLKRP